MYREELTHRSIVDVRIAIYVEQNQPSEQNEEIHKLCNRMSS